MAVDSAAVGSENTQEGRMEDCLDVGDKDC